MCIRDRFYGVLRGEHQVAVKTMRIAKITETEVAKFRSELVIMAPLHHANLVKLYGGCWNEGADKLCIVLEYCSLGSLKHLLSDGPRNELGSWEEPRFGMALGVAQCMRYLHHDQNDPIIHRDLKPDNILLAADHVPKVADFGESRHFDTRLAKEDDATGLSMTFVGTLLYAAPEARAAARR